MINPFEPRIGWALERAVTQHAGKEATIDIGTGERRTWGETGARVVLNRDGTPGPRSRTRRSSWDPRSQLRQAPRTLVCQSPAAGLIMNDLNYRLAVEELAFICDDSNIKLLVRGRHVPRHRPPAAGPL